MNITMENFKTAKYDVFSIFDDRWGLCTAGTPREYNTMTIGWGTMGTIWGPPKKGKQIITVFIRESRRTHQILQNCLGKSRRSMKNGKDKDIQATGQIL